MTMAVHFSRYSLAVITLPVKLMTEIYMSLNNMNPSIVWEFQEKKHVASD